MMGILPLLALVVSVQTDVVPSTTTAVAETAQVVITAVSDQEVSVSSFTEPSLAEATLLKSQKSDSVKLADGGWQSKIVFDLLPLAVGELEFPSLNVTFLSKNGENRVLPTPPVKIAVVNPLGSDPQSPPLHDIKGPVSAGLPLWWWFAGIALAVGAAAGIYYAKKKKAESPPPAPLVPPRPADEVALEKLASAFAKYQKDLDIKSFYSECSVIFREFLSLKFQMDAMENTTTEIFYEMRKRSADRNDCQKAREILNACDLVKFAKFIPDEKDLVAEYARMKSFVEAAK